MKHAAIFIFCMAVLAVVVEIRIAKYGECRQHGFSIFYCAFS